MIWRAPCPSCSGYRDGVVTLAVVAVSTGEISRYQCRWCGVTFDLVVRPQPGVASRWMMTMMARPGPVVLYGDAPRPAAATLLNPGCTSDDPIVRRFAMLEID